MSSRKLKEIKRLKLSKFECCETNRADLFTLMSVVLGLMNSSGSVSQSNEISAVWTLTLVPGPGPNPNSSGWDSSFTLSDGYKSPPAGKETFWLLWNYRMFKLIYVPHQNMQRLDPADGLCGCELFAVLFVRSSSKGFQWSTSAASAWSLCLKNWSYPSYILLLTSAFIGKPGH